MFEIIETLLDSPFFSGPWAGKRAGRWAETLHRGRQRSPEIREESQRAHLSGKVTSSTTAGVNTCPGLLLLLWIKDRIQPLTGPTEVCLSRVFRLRRTRKTTCGCRIWSTSCRTRWKRTSDRPKKPWVNHKITISGKTQSGDLVDVSDRQYVQRDWWLICRRSSATCTWPGSGRPSTTWRRPRREPTWPKLWPTRWERRAEK